MVAGDTDGGEWSWGKSLLLKSGILGVTVVAVLWVGWPQAPVVHHDRVSSAPVADQLTESQISSIPGKRESTNGNLELSASEIVGKNLKNFDEVLLINLNLGSRREIETLPGIGVKLADRILSYRSIHGTFQHIDELVNVSGIGKKRLQRIAPFVTVKASIEKRTS